MLTILHGDDIQASRNFYLDQKQQYADSTALDGEQVNLTDLIQVFAVDGLFLSTKVIFIDQLLTKRKKGKELDAIIAALNTYSLTHEITLWEAKELEKSTLLSLNKSTPRLFKLPQTLFLFLDNIKPDNGKKLLALFHQTIATTESEMVFFMFVRHIRMLLALKEQTDNPIDEIKRLAPWQKTKLETQSKLFQTNKLLMIYDTLFTIEKKQKTGTLSSDMISTIDFLIAAI